MPVPLWRYVLSADQWSQRYVETFLRQIVILQKHCGFTHGEAMALTAWERGDYIDTTVQLTEEARQHSQR